MTRMIFYSRNTRSTLNSLSIALTRTTTSPNESSSSWSRRPLSVTGARIRSLSTHPILEPLSTTFLEEDRILPRPLAPPLWPPMYQYQKERVQEQREEGSRLEVLRLPLRPRFDSITTIITILPSSRPGTRSRLLNVTPSPDCRRLLQDLGRRPRMLKRQRLRPAPLELR